MSVMALLMLLLASLNNQTMQLWRRTAGSVEAFQAARLAFDVIVRQIQTATLNVYWDYDVPSAPTRYLRRSDLAFVCGPASAILGNSYGPGSAVFFQAPLGRLANPASHQLKLALNVCGFYLTFGDVNANLPGFLSLPAKNRYRLMSLQTTGEGMRVFGGRNQNNWFGDQLGGARILADNVVLLLVRPLSAARLDISSVGYAMDSRLGENSVPQPPPSNQLPSLIDITMVVVSEDSQKRKDVVNGYQFAAAELATLFNNPANYDNDMKTFGDILLREKLEFRVFRQQIGLPNSKWSD